MTLTLTQAKDGGYRIHRDTCKKIEGRPTYTFQEVADDDLDALDEATAASCCKPSAAQIAEEKGAFINEPNESVDETEDVTAGESVDEGGTTESDEDSDPLDIDDTEETDMVTDDEDLIGDAPVEVKPKKVKATAGTPERTPEGREMDVVHALADILGIEVVDTEFPGYGKAIKTDPKGSIYLNSKHFADVRAVDAATAKEWVGAGLGQARGGNYVRVSVKGL